MSYLRLRQIALVARELAPVEGEICEAFGAGVCFRDPGVGKYGLHNALWALGGTFLEVVSPMQPGTAAGRYLDRRKGDGGYMFIVDCNDLEARRTHFQAEEMRVVEDLHSGDSDLWSEALHLHPRDTGGCLLSVDRHSGGEDMFGGYKWAGPAWRERLQPDVRLVGATLQCDEPRSTAERWATLLKRPVLTGDDAVFEIGLDNARVRFAPLADDRGEGMSEVWVHSTNPAGLKETAKRAGAAVGADRFALCGVQFVLTAP